MELCHPYGKGMGKMLLKQWRIICCLTVRWEGATSKTVRDGNKSLFGATSTLPLSLSHLPRLPYITGVVKVTGVQVVFSSVLSVGDWDPHKRKRVDTLNEWHCQWCCAQGFGYYGLGCSLEKGGMLTVDGNQLSRRPTNILGSKLAGLVSRALN